MTDNRTLRMAKENKNGPKPMININDKYTMRTLTYHSIDLYNRLDRRFTLIINNIKFKIVLNKLYSNPNTTFKINKQSDYDTKTIFNYKLDVFNPCLTPFTQ